jgi:hypothetical protein
MEAWIGAVGLLSLFFGGLWLGCKRRRRQRQATEAWMFSCVGSFGVSILALVLLRWMGFSGGIFDPYIVGVVSLIVPVLASGMIVRGAPRAHRNELSTYFVLPMCVFLLALYLGLLLDVEIELSREYCLGILPSGISAISGVWVWIFTLDT